ncbi:MAG: MoaD/ThiS family protein [Gammaproteobacteria bacterium]|jgi:molybdopterin converting factor small subunit|nr:MoaD/ThiS family protein [Gammaproteobacteria bacterium]MDP6617608.1 MoaD/ThiS family protein [Gammaproteobacteria bacterium]MDP6694485.1 MoaD/ThiS family protein [Gammaproteobacteria bacterium]
MKTLAIEYFAIFRDHAGTDKETLHTEADTPADLFAELSVRHGFPELQTVKVAINDEFGDWNTQLNEGDSVVFIPPVAGG